MDKDKRKIIVREIEQWRRNKLLPEHYCDFLLNLYMDDPSERTGSIIGLSSASIRDSSPRKWITFFSVFTFSVLLVLYFNVFNFSLQMAVIGVVSLICFIMGIKTQPYSMARSAFWLGGGSLFMLAAGEYVLRQHDYTDAPVVIGYIVLCSVIWLLVGIVAKNALLQFLGWAGLLLFYGWVVQEKMERELTLWLLQLVWIPASFIFLWLGWLFQQQLKQVSGVMFTVGLMVWYAPEVNAAVAADFSYTAMEIAFIAKTLVLALVLFGYRKKWTEWVVT